MGCIVGVWRVGDLCGVCCLVGCSAGCWCIYVGMLCWIGGWVDVAVVLYFVSG